MKSIYHIILPIVASIAFKSFLHADSTIPSGLKPLPQAELRSLGGVPTIFVNDRPYGPMMMAQCYTSPPNYGFFKRAVDSNFEIYEECVELLGWPDTTPAAWEAFDEKMIRLANLAPRGFFILRFSVTPPVFFGNDYPDELIRFEDGHCDHFSGHGIAPGQKGFPSMASDVWRQMTAQAIQRMTKHIAESGYGNQVIGFFIGGGATQEWNYWQSDGKGGGIDFSVPMQMAFRAFLRDKYKGNDENLRTAWNDSSVTFDTAMPPPEKDRYVGGLNGMFFDPQSQRRVQDYWYVHNKVMTDSILLFARTIKNTTQGRSLVGTFNGYLLNCFYLGEGYATVDDLVASPDIDILAGPANYKYAGPGEATLDRFMSESLRKHNKLWAREVDTKTCYGTPWIGMPNKPLPDFRQSIGMLTREFGTILCNGDSGWWFPIQEKWYDQEPIWSLFNQFQMIGKASLKFDRKSAADIAVVADFQSLFDCPPAGSNDITSVSPLPTLLEGFRVHEISRIGSMTDFIGLDDLLADPSKYKLIIMLNAFTLSEKQRKAIDSKLRQGNRTILWMFAPGFFNPDKPPNEEASTTNLSSLLGYSFEFQGDGGYRYGMKLTDVGKVAFPGWNASQTFSYLSRPTIQEDAATRTYKTEVPKVPSYPGRFIPTTQKDIEVLARFSSDSRAAFTRKRNDGITEYWVGGLTLPAEILRDIASQAGCHLYGDRTDIVYASQSFLMCHANQSGARTFKLLKKQDVVDILTGSVVARDVNSFTTSIEADDTKIYFLGDAARWEETTKSQEHPPGGAEPVNP